MIETMTQQTPAVEFRHVDKHFGNLHVLRDINLTIQDGEFVSYGEPS